MFVQIKDKQQSIRAQIKKEKNLAQKMKIRKQQLKVRSSFESIQKFIQQQNALYIIILANKIIREQAELEMTCKDQYWLIQHTLSCQNVEMKRSLFLLLLSLKIKFNYLLEMAKLTWNEIEIIPYLSFYSTDRTVVNVRDPKLVDLIVQKSLECSLQFTQDYIDTLQQIFSCLNKDQKILIIPLVNTCLISERFDWRLSGFKMLLNISQSNCIKSTEIRKLSCFPEIVNQASKDFNQEASEYSFSILRNIIMGEDEDIFQLIDDKLIYCIQMRLRDQSENLQQQTQEMISYLIKAKPSQQLVEILVNNLFIRYKRTGNYRTQGHIIKTLNNIILFSDRYTLEFIGSQDQKTFTLIIDGLAANSTDTILDSLNSVQIIAEDNILILKNILIAANVTESLQNLIEYPIPGIEELVQRILKEYQ